MNALRGYWKMGILKIPLRVLCLAGLLLSAGCEDCIDDSNLPFSHKRHLQEEELTTCEACHKGAKEGKPGKPTAKKCMKCHKGLDEKKPVERRMSSYLVNGELPRLPQRPVEPNDIKFSHKDHANAKLQCFTCHKRVAKSKHLTSGMMKQTMKECVACHSKIENVNVKNNCAYCHKTIRRDVEPVSHKVNWKLRHGKAIGFMTKESASRCETCHTADGCMQCHRREKPRNHTGHWRDRGHTVAVDLNRQSCQACHRPDYCIRCHRSAAPDVELRLGPHSRRGMAMNQGACVRCHYRLGASHLPPHRSSGFTHCLQCHRVRR